VVNWIAVGVVEWITVVFELTLWRTIVILCPEVIWVKDWFSDDLFIVIIDWHIVLFEFWNIWFVKTSFVYDFRRLERLWFNESNIGLIWVVVMVVWVVVMIVIVMWFQVVVAPQWVSMVVTSVVCCSNVLRVLTNVFDHIVTDVLRVNIASRD